MLLQAVDSFAGDEVLAAVPTRNGDDVVFLTGSRTAGLGHATSDYDAFVVTEPPLPPELAHGVMSRIGTASLDITYLVLADVDTVVHSLSVTNRHDVARIDWKDLNFAARIRLGQALQNESGFRALQSRFPDARLRELIFTWEQTRALASILEARHELEHGPAESVWTCCMRAVVHGACAAAALHGQVHMNSKWVHEKCTKVSTQEPNLLPDLLALESAPLPSDSDEASDLVDRCRAFLASHVRVPMGASSAGFDYSRVLPGPTELVGFGDSNYLVRNGWRALEVSPVVADTWRSISEGNATDDGGGRDVARSLEARGFLRFDWVGAAVGVLDGFVD